MARVFEGVEGVRLKIWGEFFSGTEVAEDARSTRRHEPSHAEIWYSSSRVV